MHNYSDCFEESGKIPGSFSISWEQRKVTEIGKIYIGLVTTMTKHYTDEGTLLIRNSDIKDGKFEFGDNPIHLEKSFAEKNETRMHQIGDVITVHTGDVGTSAVITENEAKSIGFATIVTRPNPKIIDSNYLCSFLNTDNHKKWAVSISTGDGRTNYNLGDYFELVVPVPSIAEQKKIASYIQKLNRLITLHQRKYDKLQNLKKAMLEKMFPKNGSNVPEIRFKGFTDDWEQRKLGDNIVEYTEKTTENNQYPVLTSSRKGIFFQTDYYDGNQIASADNTGYNIVPYGYFTYRHMSDDEIFHFNINDIAENGIVSTLYPVFTTDENLDSRYLQYQLNYGREFARYAILQKQGGSRTYMYLNKLRNLYLTVPTAIEEQKKISEYFTNLDHLITLHQRKQCILYIMKKLLCGKSKQLEKSIFWEQRKLGELALFNPKDELPQTFEYVDLESVVGTEMLSHRTEVKSFAPSRAQRLAHTGDLFYQTVRPYQKNNYLFEKPDNNYVFSTGYAQMRPYVDGYFLLSLVQSERFVKVVLDNCTGTSYPAINANDLAEIEVAAPSDESEVQKIGTIFRSIDNLTTLHQRKP